MADQDYPVPGRPGEPARQPSQSPAGLARYGYLEYDRVLFFSDAVFAIAITLLVVDLPMTAARSGAESGAQLRAAVPGITSFVISFAVIGLFWLGHHSVSRFITAFDRTLILLNLLFLGTIAFLPYPTEVLGRASAAQTPALIFYAACCAAAGLTEGIVWLYATRAGAGLAPAVTKQMRLLYALQIGRIPAVFLASVPVAVFAPGVTSYLWLLILVTGKVLDRVAVVRRMEQP
ncbi:MAG TPA: TMEM175 family protein [Streptosporangiaceae bacterium]|jgi:uncharacterized membrane protein